MKLNPSSLQKTVIVSAIALSSACIVAFAQSAPPSPAPGPQAQIGKERGWRDGARKGRNEGGPGMMRGMQGGPGIAIEQIGKLKNSLKLTPAQTALWDKAEKAMQPAPDQRGKMREEIKARHDQTLAALADPKFDPRKFSADMEKQQAARQAEIKTRMTAIREAWFVVYDSLDAGQRGQVREFLRARLEGRGGRGMGMMKWGRGENHGRQQARPPMPPAGPAGNMPPPPAR